MDKLLAYTINEIPDPLYPQYQMAAGNDVLSAVGRNCEHLLRTVANLPPGLVSITIRFLFAPKPTNEDKQSRLVIYVMAKYKEKGLGDTLKILFERGPLTSFCKLKAIDPTEVACIEPQAACEIVRREDAVEPLHSREFNDRIPNYYYTIRSFKPNPQNDFFDLDRVLDGIEEPVMFDVSIEPIDVASELSEHGRYLSHLQSINRTWDHDQDDDSGSQDYLGDKHSSYATRRQGLKPLRYTDPLADETFRFQQGLHESLRQPHLMFHIFVFAQTPAIARLIGSVVADSAFEEGSYRLLSWNKREKYFDKAIQSVKELHVLALPLHEYVFQGKDPNLYSGVARLSHLATVDELLGVFRLPVASTASPRCIRKNTDPSHERDQDIIVVGYDLENPGIPRGPRLSSIAKHWFISGTSGFGKTTAMLNLCIALHRHGIPFLVIESAKTEYRVLKTLLNHIDPSIRNLAEKLEIYTPGNEEVAPFRFNPLEILSGKYVDSKIGNIMSCFQAAMPLSGPLPAILGESLERVYEYYLERNNPPIIADLVQAAERVLAEKMYSTDTNSDIRGALDTRLGLLARRSIGRIFQCRRSIPSIEHLLNVSAVLELDALLSSDQKCLLTLFIFTGIREALRIIPRSDKVPRYVIIIEEGHHIVGRTGGAQPSPDVADPKAFAADLVSRMLAEVRALGVGVVIVDQLPSVVAPEVIKNTATKLAFHQVDKEDRELIGASMLLNPMEIEELARLRVGEAFFYTEGYYRPKRIKT